MFQVYIWQRMLSPHMLPLAEGIHRHGVSAKFVYCEEFDGRRKATGWTNIEADGAIVQFAPTRQEVERAAEVAPEDSIHICQGVRRNGLVSFAQRILRKRNLDIIPAIETAQGDGWMGFARTLFYRELFRAKRNDYAAYLAIGERTPQWLVDCGCPPGRVFPFTYFLRSRMQAFEYRREDKAFRILFVGQLIARKRVDLLLQAVGKLDGPIEVVVVGGGPEEARLQVQARVLPRNVSVRFLGRQDISQIPERMSSVDCLVLPSDFDGWGAVVSEALMVGTPAICSDSCGAAEVVRASGVGGVFPRGDADGLARLLSELQKRAPMSLNRRYALSDWAQALSGDAGAVYLLDIIDNIYGREARPVPPWRQSEPRCSSSP